MPWTQRDTQEAWFRRPRSVGYWSVLAGVPAAASLAVMRMVSFTRPITSTWFDAKQLVTTGGMVQRFVPAGYAAWIALGMKASHGHFVAGFELEQALLQVLLVLLAWGVARRLGATATGALVGGLVIAVHPELLLTVTKVWDVGLSTCTLLLVVWVSLGVWEKGISWGRIFALAAALGCACFDRPNDAVLVVALAYVLWRAQPMVGTMSRAAGRTGLLLLAAVGVFALLGVAVYGAPVIPQNGPYNLYAGQNAFSEQTLLRDLNAEQALLQSLRAQGMAQALAKPYDAAWSSFYAEASVAFVLRHPGQEARLVGVKLYTLLRPDTKRHKLGSRDGDLKLLLALPFPVWLLAVVRLRRHGVWTAGDTFVCAVAAVYVLPFLLTNADPRFRTPLDVLLLAHIAAILTRGDGFQGMTGDRRPYNESAGPRPAPQL